MWVLDNFILIYISILVPAPYFLYHCGFIVGFEIGKCDSSNFVSLFQDCFNYIVVSFLFPSYFVIFLQFYMNFRISLPFFVKIVVEILIAIVSDLDQFGKYYHFNNIKSFSLIHKKSSHFFRSWLISFRNVMQFLVHKSCLFFFV